jgi:bla regulator protein blaR1
VIALPPGFMALHDREARDLALAHELAHHRGGDLLVNVLVQPLFALHWFNPLCRFGWLALRRDQEAACDARVMARRTAQERAAYAALIARFAAAPGAISNAALTAPMACPVLGEKSIIHRLRSLAMSDLSPRRRLAGRALLGAGLLALPLTASISYAASESRLEAPEPPAPPAPPAPPSAPDAPEPPEAPEAPSILLINADAPEGEGGSHVTERVWRDADGKERRIKIVTRGGTDVESIERQLEGIEGADAADREAMLADMRASLAEADRVLADLPNIIGSAMAEAEAARASAPRVIVKHECDGGTEEVTETTTKDGMQIIKICQRRIMASARQGLEEARAEIARDKDIPEDTRKQLLRTLDGQIARWSDKEG